ncbi:MAG: hypothetical protein IT422_17265, partial [Pirellulaceae bacterium]|nr:hypothetical protein [Pirellulaceae bacterium]
MNFLRLVLVAELIAASCIACPIHAAEGLVFSGLGLTPQTRAVPGNTVTLMARVGNSGTEPLTGTVVAKVEQLPYLQSARSVRLEPGEERSFKLFIQLPQQIDKGGLHQQLDVVATLVVRDGAREVILQRDGKPATQTLSLPVLPEGRVMAMQAAPAPAEGLSWDWPPPVTPSGYDFVVAARVDSTRDRKSVSYDGQPLPLQLMEWDALDLFVVADPAALQDPAAIEAMRLFMLRGGRLWVMLDQVPGELIQPLLNPRQSLVEVERVMLNQFTIETDYPATDFFESDLFVDLEREVMMARVVQHGGQVLHSVDGWPISMVFPVGYGQLLVTTLDS